MKPAQSSPRPGPPRPESGIARLLAMLVLLAVVLSPITTVLAADGDAALRRAVAAALATPAPATTSHGDVLSFRRDAAVTAEARSGMLARVEAQGGSGSGLAKSVESGRMLKTFDGLLKRNGYSPDDLGDVLAAYLVLAWEVVNDADATTQRDGMRAVRRQIGPALAALPQFAGMSNAEKQGRAQNTAYMAMVATLNRQAFKAAGDQARLSALEREVGEQITSSTGIDLRDYRLGNGGLVPR